MADKPERQGHGYMIHNTGATGNQPPWVGKLSLSLTPDILAKITTGEKVDLRLALWKKENADAAKEGKEIWSISAEEAKPASAAATRTSQQPSQQNSAAPQPPSVQPASPSPSAAEGVAGSEWNLFDGLPE